MSKIVNRTSKNESSEMSDRNRNDNQTLTRYSDTKLVFEYIFFLYKVQRWQDSSRTPKMLVGPLA